MNLSRLLFIFLLFFVCAKLNALAPETVQKDSKKGGEILELPCQEIDSIYDKKYFHATGTGTHANPRVAQRMARLDANANMAANIDIKVKVVSERYLKENHKGKVSEKFESLMHSVTDHELSNVTVICSESEYHDGKHTFYIAVKTPKNDILENVEKTIAGDESIGTFYNKEKFGKIFDQEMENLENVSDSIGTK